MAAAEAELIKQQANECFKFEQFEKAIELYSQAIELSPETAAYYGNRSFAYLKEELYGAALADADRAIELDAAYVKAYYRRATANMALGKFKLALRDYDAVHRARPADADARRKFDECRQMVRRLAFERAIAVDSDHKTVAEQIALDAFVIDDKYTGPRLDDGGSVSLDFMRQLLSLYKQQGKLHTRYAYKILLDIKQLFEGLPSLVDIDVPKGKKFTICGDVHGQFYDLVNIFELNGLPSEDNPYLFNGDFVDRGSFSVETIFTLFGFRLLYPQHFFMSRGNHESHVMNQMYGFEGEVKSKYSQQMADLFTEIFNWLPLCHLINKSVFVTHGGLFNEDDVTLEQIRQVERNRQPPDQGIMCDLLWSDPHELDGRSPSKRGVGCQFGADVTRRFCQLNGVKYVVRSHEVKPDGFELNHDGQCVTVFSAPNYCDTMGNKGAFITLDGSDLRPKFTSYEAVGHPKVKPMAYANSIFGFL